MNEPIERFKRFIKEEYSKINPAAKDIANTEKIIREMIIILSLIFIFTLCNDFKRVFYLFRMPDFITLYFVLSFFPLIIIPLAVYFLLKRKTAGWIFTTVFLTLSFTGMLITMIYEYSLPSYDDKFVSLFFQKTPITTYIFG